MAGKHLEQLSQSSAGTAVDPVDEPSAEWGWHGQFPRVTRFIGWLMIPAVLGMLVGNHVGNIENLYVVATAAALAFLLIRDARRRRTAWRQ